VIHFASEVIYANEVNVVLEERIYRIIRELAEKDGLSLSMVSRELIREALELREDAALAAFAESRAKTLKEADLIDHDETWKD